MQQVKSSAYVLAPHEDVAFLELKSLLKPFGITRFFTDGWGAYQRHLDQQVHIVGKSNTQKIERKHLTSENKNQAFSTQNNLLL
jgi:insertion element IS1 protein InsB